MSESPKLDATVLADPKPIRKRSPPLTSVTNGETPARGLVVLASATPDTVTLKNPVASHAASDGMLPAVFGDTVASSPEKSARQFESERTWNPGSCIGRLEILRLLGSGGMGIVYAAYDPKLDREVAVKVIRPLNENEIAQTRIYREAHALAKLSHPNVVAIYDVGTHDDRVWISMEFVAGRTLENWAREEQPTWRQALSVIKQAADGIAAAHAEGLLHRDIKSENIMVGDDGRVRVMDFGLARADV
ncbi:MAG: serine/threonine-protein kinase, partial [Nannocystaceae bacterium]